MREYANRHGQLTISEQRAPAIRAQWHAEPAKVFDNLYFVGQTEYSAWALTTSDGIILVDTIFDYSVEDEVVNGLKKLKDETEGTILVAGSGTLVRTLLENDLVDELRLMIFPTILGRGQRLFPDGIDRLNFTLAEWRTVGPDGVQVQVYERAG